MTEANERRGEISLLLEGDEYVMRPTYEAITRVEKETGKSILVLVNTAQEFALSMKEVGIIACRFINAWGKKVENSDAAGANPDRIAEMVYDSDGGMMVASLAITRVLILAATGGYTAAGEPKGTTLLPLTPSDDLQDIA